MSNTTVEVPHDLWQAYLNTLVARYAGWRLTVDVLNMEIGSQRAVDGLALVGLSLETKGSEAGDILIEAGDMAAALMIHHVDQPRCVRVTASLPGSEIDIQIESDDGTTTILVLRRRPELPPASTARQETLESGSAGADAPVLTPMRARPHRPVLRSAARAASGSAQQSLRLDALPSDWTPMSANASPVAMSSELRREMGRVP